jgi:uncharacterized protein (TIGR03437 family)
MRKTSVLLVLLFALGAQTLPIRLDPIGLMAPATGTDGRSVLFAAATAPDGGLQAAINLYLWSQGTTTTSTRRLTNYTGDNAFSGVTGVTYGGGNLAGFTAVPAGPGNGEEVHVIDVVSGGDRTVAVDKEPCAQPLTAAIACVNCFSYCVGPIHLSPDSGKVLYAARRDRPFYVVNGDGSGLTRLPIYSGSLAPSPQRVISRAGVVVFTSSAPFGPTFAAQATDVYTMSLNGTGITQVTRFGNASVFAASATISLDGSQIAFARYDGPASNSQIWTMRADGSDLHKLSPGAEEAAEPSISGDGSMVVFVQSGQIRRANTRGEPSILTLTKLSTSVPHSPAVSEDGTQVTFTLSAPSGLPAAVYRIPTNASAELRQFFTIYAPRVLAGEGVTGAAGYGPPSPGSLISVYGVNIGVDELTQAGAFPLPTVLKEVSLLVNGQAVPLQAVTPWQINAQLPQTVNPGTATFQVRYSSGGVTNTVSAGVSGVSPADFSFPFSKGSLFYTQAAAFHPGTGVVADMDHPATSGETLEIYGLGLGVTDPMVEAGIASPVSPLARARIIPQLEIGGKPASITFAGLTPGLAGVYQVNAAVPSGLTPGIQTLVWRRPEGPVSYSAIAVK